MVVVALVAQVMRYAAALAVGAVLAWGAQGWRMGAQVQAGKTALETLRREHAESLRQAELERAVRLLAKGEDPQRVLEALSHGLTNKLIHGPTRFLNQAEGEHKAEAGRVVRELFNLSRDHH